MGLAGSGTQRVPDNDLQTLASETARHESTRARRPKAHSMNSDASPTLSYASPHTRES